MYIITKKSCKDRKNLYKKLIIICSVCIIVLGVSVVTLFTLKQKESRYEKLYGKLYDTDLKDEIGDKLSYIGKSMSHNGNTFEINGMYVDEENRKVYTLVVIDGKEELEENDFRLTLQGKFCVLRNESGELYQYDIKPVGADIEAYYGEILEGKLYLYFKHKYLSNGDDIYSNIRYMYVTYDVGDSYFDLGGLPYLMSSGMQYYSVENNDVLVTNYGVLTYKEFEIDTLQVYMNGGAKLFDSETIDLETSIVKDVSHYNIYWYEKIDCTNVKNIEINGKKYYPSTR